MEETAFVTIKGSKENLRVQLIFNYHNSDPFSCPVREALCNLFCQDDETLDLCNVKSIGNFQI